MTRDKWLLPLLYELGWGRLEAVSGGLDVPPGLGETTAPHFPDLPPLVLARRRITRRAWVPLHLVGAGVDLDTKTPSVTARAPQSMVQDYLNREHRCLWAIVSNGRTAAAAARRLSLTRSPTSSSTSTKSSPTSSTPTSGCSSSPPTPAGSPPASTDNAPRSTAELPTRRNPPTRTPRLPAARLDNCWLERWRTTAIDDGARARLNLQHGIAARCNTSAPDSCPAPTTSRLRETLASTHDADRDLHRALLRIAYRLIVLFVAEDRGLLHTADVARRGAERCTPTTSPRARLRQLAADRTRRPAHRPVGSTSDRHRCPGRRRTARTRAQRPRRQPLRPRRPRHPRRGPAAQPRFLAAVRALAQIDDPITGTPRPVDYRNLDSEEFGGMYEGLLAYTPALRPADRTFTLDLAAGNDRKKSGSYYTPSELIDSRPRRSLDPLIDEAVRAPDPEPALLDTHRGRSRLRQRPFRRRRRPQDRRRTGRATAPATPNPSPRRFAPPPPT